MSAAKQSNSQTPRHRTVQPGRRSGRQKGAFEGWTKKSTALAALLGTTIAVVAAVRSCLPDPANTTICTDKSMDLVRVGDHFEFQLALTLNNASASHEDRIFEPSVRLTTDKEILEFSPDKDVRFEKEQGGRQDFPVILTNKDLRIICKVSWKPTADYFRLIPDDAGEVPQTQPVLGSVDLEWAGAKKVHLQRPFNPVVPTIDEVAPDRPRTIHYLNVPNYCLACGSNALSSNWFGSEGRGNRVALIGTGGTLHVVSLLATTFPGLLASTEYAKPGDTASGKEVPSANANEVGVNVRPCGGEEEVVVFRKPYKKAVMGKLACGVVMIQVEQQWDR